MKTFISAFLAGALIALGGGVYILTDNQIAGAILFCLGLLAICILQLDLFTGKIGFMLLEEPLPWKKLLIILMGNLIGALFMGTMLGLTDGSAREAAYTIISTKTSEHFWRVLGSSFATGILMYLAVKIYKTGSPLGIFLCVPAFLLSGFDHCIAIAAYIAMGAAYTWLSLAFLVLSIVGNTIGSLFISTTINYLEETNGNKSSF